MIIIMSTSQNIIEKIQQDSACRKLSTVPICEQHSVHVCRYYSLKAEDKGSLRLPNYSLSVEGKFHQGQLWSVARPTLTKITFKRHLVCFTADPSTFGGDRFLKPPSGVICVIRKLGGCGDGQNN